MKFEWQKLAGNEGSQTWRAKVIGGWILNNFTVIEMTPDRGMRNGSESMVFVPDPDHKWSVET
jgi:hypothetical protein